MSSEIEHGRHYFFNLIVVHTFKFIIILIIIKIELSNWVSARKKFKGGKRQRPLFFKTIGYCLSCSFCCFLKILGGQMPFRGAKVVFGGRPLPPCSRKPVKYQFAKLLEKMRSLIFSVETIKNWWSI